MSVVKPAPTSSVRKKGGRAPAPKASADEPPGKLRSWVAGWSQELRPRNDAELKLVKRAARLCWQLDRIDQTILAGIGDVDRARRDEVAQLQALYRTLFTFIRVRLEADTRERAARAGRADPPPGPGDEPAPIPLDPCSEGRHADPAAVPKPPTLRARQPRRAGRPKADRPDASRPLPPMMRQLASDRITAQGVEDRSPPSVPKPTDNAGGSRPDLSP